MEIGKVLIFNTNRCRARFYFDQKIETNRQQLIDIDLAFDSPNHNLLTLGSTA
jgi:hypothetical protein